MYLGLRRRRISDSEMTEFMDELMHEITNVFPKLLVQFEVRLHSSSFFTST
jgi:malate dehydrogenase (oxaloacetate-decarboxylating)(NADP+)